MAQFNKQQIFQAQHYILLFLYHKNKMTIHFLKQFWSSYIS